MKKIFILSLLLFTILASAQKKKPLEYGGGSGGGSGANGDYDAPSKPLKFGGGNFGGGGAGGDYDAPEVKKVVPVQVKKDIPIPKIVLPENSCQWSSKLKPRLLKGENCNNSNQGVCTGFVNCNENGKKFKALATCSLKYCNNQLNSALNCRNEKGFKSEFAVLNQSKENTENSSNNESSGVNK